LRVFNADNPPLHVQQVNVFRQEVGLVFECKPGQRYEIVGGNPNARAPSFDLARTQPQLLETAWPSVEPGPLTPIEHPPILAPWTERHSILLWAALVAAAVLMVVLVVKNLTRPPAEQE